ncbi:hypothetical protein TREAZ_2452 [Leadbettera azotonutricia ZAS-9]|uniref:Uncharacterized protein n=1 Tax=Leadbettera azotonutricia (strain ATCC BAA-888 / DSM 13862 / ZAS-9) TaxID=545695 RepID=F5YFR8_LEAAZ|nr:hypothetical protein TREAZ_2452 [Leadbettera azotonutricia ZAS-9]
MPYISPYRKYSKYLPQNSTKMPDMSRQAEKAKGGARVGISPSAGHSANRIFAPYWRE